MRKPDFIGNWDPFGYSLRSGRFLVFINKRAPLSEGVESIEGIIKDFLGNAQFTGEISPEHIRFTKSYPPASISKGAAEEGVVYEGKKVGEAYVGNYTVGKGGKKVYTTEFIMRATPNSLDLKIHKFLTI